MAAAVLLAPLARAERIDLNVFENASGTSLAGLDLWADVTPSGGSSVDFTFRNESTIAAIVTAVYFDRTTTALNLLTNGRVVTPQPTGVQFSAGSSPANPAGSIRFFDSEWNGNLFSADADSPGPRNGIGIGESLVIRFDFVNAQVTFEALLTALLDREDFRIAQHVQGVGPGGDSVWTVNEPPLAVIPLPSHAAMGLLGLGLVGAGRSRRGR